MRLVTLCLVILEVTSVVKSKPSVVKLSCDDIRKWVDVHNDYRRLLASGKLQGQPKASNMEIMEWDEELATKAEQYSTKISGSNLVHNPVETVPSGRFETGENLAMYGTQDKRAHHNVTQAVTLWFNENRYYTYEPLDPFKATDKKKATGHFTQVVWATTNKVGCAVSKEVTGRWTTFIYVCNYGPGGNYVGEYPFNTGEGCDELCGSGQNKYGKNC